MKWSQYQIELGGPLIDTWVEREQTLSEKSIELAVGHGKSLRECLYFKEEECKKLVREG